MNIEIVEDGMGVSVCLSDSHSGRSYSTVGL